MTIDAANIFVLFLQIPICSSTGGLVDTVEEGVTGFHMGSFNVEVKNNTDSLFSGSINENSLWLIFSSIFF
jgi:hypothetical protein